MAFWKKILPKSEFFKNVLKLFSSTVVAGLIQAGALTIITRLYSKADIGNYQLLLSIILIFGLIASLKYEQAIVLPKKEEDQDNLIVVSMLVLIGMSLFFLALFGLFDEPLLNLLDAGSISEYAVFIPIGIFLIGLLQVCRFILIRKKLFGDLAKNKVYQTTANQGLAIGWGAVSPSFIGLYAGYIFGILAPVGIVLSKKLFTLKYFTLSAARRLMNQYKKFPLFNTASIFLNNFSLQLPVFMFSNFFDADILGLYAIANQATVMPINLIGASVAQVYYKEASERFNDGASALMNIYLQTVKKLTLIGLLPLAAIVTLAPYLAGIIFGEEWAVAGIYMQIISIGIYFRFINSPIATTFSIINRHEIALVLIAASVIIRYAAMYIFRENPISMLWALSIATAVFYAAYNLMVYWFIRKAIQAEANNGL